MTITSQEIKSYRESLANGLEPTHILAIELLDEIEHLRGALERMFEIPLTLDLINIDEEDPVLHESYETVMKLTRMLLKHNFLRFLQGGDPHDN